MLIRPDKHLVQRYAFLVALVLLWMGGGASLTHNDSCDDVYNVLPGHIRLSTQSPLSGPDQCAACAWSAAGNICIPVAMTAPVAARFDFEPQSASAVRVGISRLSNITPRGPPAFA